MKSELFNTAWKLTKEFGYTFSEALKMAWKTFKNKITIEYLKSPKGVKSLNFRFTDFPNRSSMFLNTLLNTKYVNSDASHSYGNGVYNGD